MSGDRPKLNLRGETEPAPKAEPVSGQKSDLEEALASIPRQKSISEQPFSGDKTTSKRKSLPKAGNVLKDRGKQRKSDISELWDDFHEDRFWGNESVVDVARSAARRLKEKFTSSDTSARSRTRARGKSRVASNLALPLGQFTKHRKKLLTFAAALIAIGLIALIVGGGDGKELNNGAATAGASTDSSSVTSEPIQSDDSNTTNAEIVDDTSFTLLYPVGTSIDDYEVALVSPPNNDPVYAYVDTFNGAELRVSQQEIPQAFEGQVSERLEEIARDFQATDLLQIDDIAVYHGFTERFGGVQSLVFIKDDVMIFISSAQKFSDDDWVGYILSLL